MKKYVFEVNKEFDGHKIKDFLKREIGLSEVVIKTVKYGHVLVNGEFVDMRKIVKLGDKISVTLPPDPPNDWLKPKDVPLEVLYEDDYLLAVFKPSGMPCHNSWGLEETTLQEVVTHYSLPENITFRAVNRLDKDTAGIVIIAKDHISASFLGKLMASGDFVKHYHAVVSGVPEKKHDIIDLPIKRIIPSRVKRGVLDGGKRAITEYFVEKELDDNKSLLKVILHTGRTHQIRVHLSHIGHPLYADELYGKRVEGKTYSLTAYYLEFTHPFTKERIKLNYKGKSL